MQTFALPLGYRAVESVLNVNTFPHFARAPRKNTPTERRATLRHGPRGYLNTFIPSGASTTGLSPLRAMTVTSPIGVGHTAVA